MNRIPLRLLPPLLMAATLALLLAGLAAAGGPGASLAAAPPLPETNIPFDSDVLSVAVQGDYAYVGQEDAGVAILDISTPLHPVVVSSFDEPDRSALNYVETIIPDGDILVVPYGLAFYVVDISDPVHPSWLSYRHPAAYEVKAMALYDRRAYGLGRDSFEIWDLHDPSSPQLLYSMRDQYHHLFAYMMAIAVARNPADGRIYAYMTGEPYCFHDCIGNGLVFMDVTDPTQPETIYTSVDNGKTLTAQDEYLYWGDFDGNVVTFQLTNPQEPTTLSRFDLQGIMATDMAFAQDRLYLALGHGEYGKVQVLDVSNKASPTTVVLYHDVRHWMSLAYSQETGCLFVAELSRGLRVLCDINTNPQPPALVWLPMVQARSEG